MAKHVIPVNTKKDQDVKIEQRAKWPPIHVPETSNKESDIVVEKAMSATEVSSKIYELAIYKKAISNPMHSWRWKKAIEEEIQNSENHYT